jgi:uncharacterized membrane protein YccC
MQPLERRDLDVTLRALRAEQQLCLIMLGDEDRPAEDQDETILDLQSTYRLISNLGACPALTVHPGFIEDVPSVWQECTRNVRHEGPHSWEEESEEA